MRRPPTQKPPTPEGTQALANLARVFWDAAVREVEERINTEETAPKQPVKEKAKKKS